MAARRLLDRARRLLQADDAAGAIREATVLLQQFPASGLAVEAQLLVANGHVALGDDAAARQAAEDLLSAYPRAVGAAAASIIVARFDIDAATSLGDFRAVRERLSRLPVLFDAVTYPRLEARAAAMVLSGEISLRLRENDAAEGEFAAALEPGISSALRARAHVGLGTALLRGGEWEAAAMLLQSSATEVPEARTALSLIHRHRLKGIAAAWESSRTLASAGRRLDNPVGIAASNSGELVVVDEGERFAARLRADGSVAARRNPLRDAARPWFGADGTAFVTMKQSILAPFTQVRQTFTTRQGGQPKAVQNIVAAAHGPLGGVVIAHDNGDRVSRFDAEGVFVGLPLGDRRMEIVDVVVDVWGRFLLLDKRGKSVVAVDAEGQVETVVTVSGWRRPEALAVDALGNFYVLDRDAKLIDVYSNQGTHLTRLGPTVAGGGSLDDPRDIAVDGSGRIYIADRGRSAIVVLE